MPFLALESTCQNCVHAARFGPIDVINTSTCGAGFGHQLVQPFLKFIVFGFLPDFDLPLLSACISPSIETQHFIQLIQFDCSWSPDGHQNTSSSLGCLARYRCSGDSTSPRVCDERERPLPDWLAPRE